MRLQPILIGLAFSTAFYLLLALLIVAVAAPVDPNIVTVPVQGWASGLADLLVPVVIGAIGWGLRKLPGEVRSILLTQRVEQLLTRAVEYGVNAVIDATLRDDMTVEVGNKVAAEALQYALDKAPAAVIDFAGGEQRLAQMIRARLPYERRAAIGDGLPF